MRLGPKRRAAILSAEPLSAQFVSPFHTAKVYSAEALGGYVELPPESLEQHAFLVSHLTVESGSRHQQFERRFRVTVGTLQRTRLKIRITTGLLDEPVERRLRHTEPQRQRRQQTALTRCDVPVRNSQSHHSPKYVRLFAWSVHDHLIPVGLALAVARLEPVTCIRIISMCFVGHAPAQDAGEGGQAYSFFVSVGCQARRRRDSSVRRAAVRRDQLAWP